MIRYLNIISILLLVLSAAPHELAMIDLVKNLEVDR